MEVVTASRRRSRLQKRNPRHPMTALKRSLRAVAANVQLQKRSPTARTEKTKKGSPMTASVDAVAKMAPRTGQRDGNCTFIENIVKHLFFFMVFEVLRGWSTLKFDGKVVKSKVTCPGWYGKRA